jgi:radical SAM protein with 4Fe4S-binding SPASM domain
MAGSTTVMSKTFCHAPWTNLEILPNGDILPCCKFQNTNYDEKFNIQSNTVEQFRNSKFLSEIKTQLQQNQWPQGCNRCQIEENIGVKSKRILDNERWHSYYQDYNLYSNEILTVSMALGNTCNLKCIMCNPYSSSLWAREYQDVYSITVKNLNQIRKDVISDIAHFAPNLVHIDFHGGEPFLSNIDDHLCILDNYINSRQAENISIHYNTNATLFPDQHFWQRLRQFKHVDIQLSIDGVGARCEYIRYPAKWSELEHNIHKYQQQQQSMPTLQLSVAHTLSAFNIYYLEEFYQWCRKTGLPDPWIGRLHRPEHLRPTVWNGTARQIIVDKLKSADTVDLQSWADLFNNCDDSRQFDQFVQFVHTHDAYRKLNFSEVFPDLAQFI